MILILGGLTFFSFTISSVKAQNAGPIDVVHYNITIEPDIQNKTIKGSVVIRFLANVNNLSSVEFDCGDLEIESVKQGGQPRQFSVKDRHLKISVPPLKSRQSTELHVSYHGTPKYGIRFFPDTSQVYTVFSTSQWTVCIDAPDDRSTVSLALILPSHLTPQSSGRLVSTSPLPNNRSVSVWEQRSPIPTYIFGFAAGPYRVIRDNKHGVELRYLVTGFTDDEARRIFRDTPDMLQFYTRVAGVKYADKTYSQVLASGDVAQEMSSFTAINEPYGKYVLDNEQRIWLGAHEFAHQWWGNMVTNRSWSHFWLNEGITNFMTAAYLEHRFGRAAYLREIESYKASYEKVRDAGKDKSLVFPDWRRPTREDRILVYDKGAYVMHLLREEMGERAFWKGVRIFTSRYFGKSVETADFEAVMEEAHGRSLDQFFARWVYLRR